MYDIYGICSFQKRLRQMDRDILRQFLIINDTIEEQKWMMEEKQEAIKLSLSEEGEDPVNFDSVQEAAEERDDDIAPTSSQHNTKASNQNSPPNDVRIAKNDSKIIGKDSDLVSTSSDSALSMTGESSTLSSTTSLPISNRSTSPTTSNLSTTSASSSYVDNIDGKATSRTEPIRRFEHELEGDDVEGYFRMNGHAMKRGSYPFPRQSQSFDMSYTGGRGQTYDDNTLDSAYSTRRGSTDSDSRDPAEYGMAVRRGGVNRSYETQYRSDGYQARAVPRSNSVRGPNDMRNNVTRISVRPDGTVDNQNKRNNGIRRVRSERTPDRQFPNSGSQRHLAKFNITRQVASLSFVPIAEQEPDVMLENGRFYSPKQNTRSPSKVRQDHYRHMNPSRGLDPTMRNHLPEQVTNYSRASPLSPPRSSSSHSSILSQSNYVINEADQYTSHGSKCNEPVWVPQFPGSVKKDNHYGGTGHYQSLLAHQSYSFHRNHFGGTYTDHYNEKSRGKYTQRVPTNCTPEYRDNLQNQRVSRSTSNSKGSAQAVYQWIQTQDDVTYL